MSSSAILKVNILDSILQKMVRNDAKYWKEQCNESDRPVRVYCSPEGTFGTASVNVACITDGPM